MNWEKELPPMILLRLGLNEANVTYGDSFEKGKIFYGTRYPDMYLTNFDVGEFNKDSGYEALKQDWLLYYKSHRLCYAYVSYETLGNTELFNQLLEHLHRNFTRQTVAGLPLNWN